MRRLRSWVIVFGLLGFCALAEPTRLAELTAPCKVAVSTWISAPFSFLRAPAYRIEADPDGVRAAESVRRALNPRESTGHCFDVVHQRVDLGYLLIAGGRIDGVALGQVVAGRGVFAGFIDRVSDHYARVRLLTRSDCFFSGAVIAEDQVTRLRRVERQVLLKGNGADLAVTERGSVIPESCNRQVVESIEGAHVPGGLLIGRVRDQAHLGLPAIDLEIADLRLDRVVVYSSAARVIQPAAQPRFDRTEALVNAISALPSGRLVIHLNQGSEGGVRPGAWLSAGGYLLGRIRHVSGTASHAEGVIRPSFVFETATYQPGRAEDPPEVGTALWTGTSDLRDGLWHLSLGRHGEPAGLILSSPEKPHLATGLRVDIWSRVSPDELRTLGRGLWR